MTSSVILKDGNEVQFQLVTTLYADGSKAFYHVPVSSTRTITNRNGIIASGSVSQQLAPANVNRTRLSFQNTSANIIYISDNGSAASATNGYKLASNDKIEILSNAQINIFCTVASSRFVATEFILV